MRVAPWSGSTRSWFISSIFWAVVFVWILSGRHPLALYREMFGAAAAFTEHDAALLHAATAGDAGAAAAALGPGARVDAVEPTTRHTPLIRAARAGSLPLVDLLLQRGADATIVGGENRTAFDEAIQHASAEVVQRLLATAPALDRESGGDGRTPVAAAVGRYRQAVSAKATAAFGNTAHAPDVAVAAAEKEMTTARRILQVLLEAGADASKGGNASVPLVDAIHAGSLDLVTALLDHGADARAIDPASGETVLGAAVDTCAPEGPAIVRTLLARGASPDAKGTNGRSARERHRAATTSRDDCRAILNEIGVLLK